MSDERRGDEVGLIGGSLEQRQQHAKVPPLELDRVLAPFRREGDEDLTRRFVAARPLQVEIGFGRPHYLCGLAAQQPEARVLGFEIRRRWCRDAARRSLRLGLDNLRVIEGDARALIPRLLGPETVDGYHVLFPDPWWKKRHHKRRIFQRGFVDVLAETLAVGGMLVVKTDVPAYADLIRGELLAHGALSLAAGGSSDRILAALPRSHREKKCAELGIPVLAFRFVKEES